MSQLKNLTPQKASESSSRFKVPAVESWSPVMRLLGKRFGFWPRMISGIVLALFLVALAYFDVWTFDQINLKPLAGLVVLAAFVIFRMQGIWWLLGVILVYQLSLSRHRLLPSANEMAADDIIVAVTFAIIGLLVTRVADGILALRRVHQEIYRDLKLAGEVQRHILSQPLRLPWIAAEGVLKPIGEIGGDFYLILPKGDDDLFFAIGDVQGKGVAAALTMAKVMAILTELSRVEQPLHRVLSELNHRLLEVEDSMVTACLGRVLRNSKKSAELRISRAGHENGVLIKKDGTCSELDVPGLPLGIFHDASYVEQTVRLGPEDRLLFYTDGVVEARNKELECFGREQFLDRAATLADIPGNYDLHRWLVQLIDEVQLFQGSRPQEDDMALLGLFSTPS